MNRITRVIFLMELMTILLLIFAIAIAAATFLESDFDTNTARALVYNAKWFEVLFLLLAINFIGNFLGAIWANESWGRYWAWDPKEAWALVTIFV